MQAYLTKRNFLIFILTFCFAGLLVAFDNIFKTHILNTNWMNRAAYAKALSYQKNGDYKKAYYAYNDISKLYSAADAVLINQAECAAKIGDEKTVIEKYKTLLTTRPYSKLAPMASYKLAQAYLRIQNDEKAEKQFKKIVKQYKGTNYEIASYYYLGEFYKKSDLKEAGKLWIKYLELSPEGRFAKNCLGEIKSHKLQMDSNEKLTVAIALYSNKMYADALVYLRQVSLSKSWYYIAKSYQNLGQKSVASKIFLTGITKYSKSVNDQNLNNAIFAYAQTTTSPKLKVWTDITNLIVKNHANGGDFAMYNRAQYLKKQDAISVYSKILHNYPNSKYATEATWQLLWSEYQKGNYKKALLLGRKHLAKSDQAKENPQILFWTGKSAEKIGKKHLAKTYYNKLLTKYPDDYYSFRANGRLEYLKYANDPGWSTIPTNQIQGRFKVIAPYSDYEMNTKYGNTINELLKIGDFDLIESLKLKDKLIDSWISYRKGDNSHSIVMAREGLKELGMAPDKNDPKWKLLFPLHYSNLINKYAKINGLDPFITLALMREESYFNKGAVSCSNAQGLMQLMPATALYIAHNDNLYYSSLGDPESNIKLGTAYLSYTQNELNGKMMLAVGAYNGGPGAVTRWTKTLKYRDMDEFVEKIPYEQTRTYIKKVYRSYWNYRRIYS